MRFQEETPDEPKVDRGSCVVGAGVAAGVGVGVCLAAGIDVAAGIGVAAGAGVSGKLPAAAGSSSRSLSCLAARQVQGAMTA